MDAKQTLEKAIQKAIDGGWKSGGILEFGEIDSHDWEVRGNGVYYTGSVSEIREDFATVIFNHDFAKALWGDEPMREHYGVKCSVTRPAYAHHLQQLVIAEDPIKYLEKNI